MKIRDSIICFLIFSVSILCGCRSQSTEEKNITLYLNDRLENTMSDSPELEYFEKEIKDFLTKWEVKGATLAIARNDSLVYAKGFGYADFENKEPMRPGTMMRIASVSKLITAVAIMQLVEEGRLRLDSKVFGPHGILKSEEITTALGDSAYYDITIENLLRHRGGFGSFMGDPMFRKREIMEAFSLNEPPDKEELIKLIVAKPLKTKPGEVMRYSNFGYYLLSMVIEKITGMDYETYVQEKITLPLGAADFYLAGNYETDRRKGESYYYMVKESEPIEEFNNSGRLVQRCYGGNDIRGLAGAGGWIASAPELALLITAIDGNSVRPDILSIQSIEKMTKNINTSEEDRGIGLGWHHVTSAGEWSRTGSLSCTGAVINRFPDGDIWIMITNTGSWRGPAFPQIMKKFLSEEKERFGAKLPRQDLFLQPSQ